MPITHNIEVKHISDTAFHSIDFDIMAMAFSIQKDLGRFLNEKIYQHELACRCKDNGYDNIETEVPIQVSYRDFNKIYYVDLLVDNAVAYELKAVKSLSGEHHTQTLNYLFLLGIQRGKIINMNTASVQHRFISTKITRSKRFHFSINDYAWYDLDEDSIWLKQLMIDLINEWGTHLDFHLFYEAIYHFRGGKENVVQQIEIKHKSNVLGLQKVHLLNSEIGFRISSITKGRIFYEKDLQRFINLTSLKAIHWINFNHDRITFKTILKATK